MSAPAVKPAHLSMLQPEKPVEAQAPGVEINMNYLVRALVKYSASDLHIKMGRPPLFRINGRLIPAKMEKLTAEQIQKILSSVLSERQRQELENKRAVDLSFRMGNYGRFRCSVFYTKGSLSSVIRMIPIAIPSFRDLGIPEVVKELCLRQRGLILVTGPTGAGKSTTLAAMIQQINETRHQHILTLEDPIEFVFRDQKASITQREIGIDTRSFKDGLIEGLRQDPDVIVLGELRDADLIRTAITAAETGHLVISTLHTKDARGTIERMLDVFPSEAQTQIRMELASVLVGTVSQHLLLKQDGTGRVPAFEVMVKSPAIENLIAKNELDQIPAAIAGSNNYYKMITFNQSLEALVKSAAVKLEEALKISPNPADLQLRMDGIRHDGAYEMAIFGGKDESVPNLVPSKK